MRKKAESFVFSSASFLSQKVREELSAWETVNFPGWGIWGSACGTLLLGSSFLFGQAPPQNQIPVQNEKALPEGIQPLPQDPKGPMLFQGRLISDGEESEETEGPEIAQVFPPVPREMRRSMEDARKLIEMERFAEAGRKLDQILGAEEDYFFLLEMDSDESGGVSGGHFGNLQQEAERLLETMPPRGKELYETEFGTVARLLLEEALAEGKPEKLNQLSRRYFFTRAGRQAAFLLGLSLLDQQQYVSARKQFERIYSYSQERKEFEPSLTLYLATACLAGGQKESAKEIFRQSLQEGSFDYSELRIGEVSVNELLAGENDSASALTALLENELPELKVDLPEEIRKSWDLLLQNQARSVCQGAVSMPILTPVWKSSMVDDPEGNVLLTLLKEKNEQQILNYLLPSHSPLVVGKTILMRTLWNLSAVDLETGKKLWAVPSQDYAGIRSQITRLDESQLGSAQGLPPSQRIHQLMAGLIQHQIFGEKIYGELASDGKFVFCVEDTLQRYVPVRESILVRRLGAQNAAFSEKSKENDPNTIPNRLACYDIRTGKLIWHLGGASASWNLSESGAMFLGAPLCVENTLYVLAQHLGQIRLLAIEAENGNVLWSQTLCLAPTAFQANPTPCTPRLCEGMLICPTPNQLLVGVDSFSRKLAWANVYGDPAGANDEVRYFDSRIGSLLQSTIPVMPGTEVVTVGEKVLYLGMNNTLICLDGISGETFWKKPIHYVPQTSGANILYAEGDQIAVLNGNYVLIYSLEKGTLLRRESLADFGKPSGRGFASGESYVLPFGNEKIVRFDIKNWNALEVISRNESGELGNLVPAGDFILSQGTSNLTAFIQKSAANEFVRKTREMDPQSPEALQVEAMILWQDGKLREALELLKSGGALTRELFKKYLLEMAEKDSNSDFDSWFSEMESQAEKFLFIQRVVERMEEEKRWRDALTWCRKAVQEFDALDESISVSRQELNSVSGERTEMENTVKNELNPHDSFSSGELWLEVPIIAGEETKDIQNPQSEPNEAAGSGSREEELRKVFQDLKIFQSFDVWLGERLSRIAKNSSSENGVRGELETWSAEEAEKLHQEFGKLKEKGDFSSDMGENLQKNLAKYRIRFAFQKNPVVEDDYFQLVKSRENIPAIEAFIGETESDPAKAAASLAGIFEEMEDYGRAALYVRHLERKYPAEKVLDGKTAKEWRLGLSEDNPIRKILDPELLEFPVGKIIVTKEKNSAEDEPSFSLSTRYSSHHFSMNSPFEDIVFRGKSAPEVLWGEDTLGRNLFRMSLGGEAEAAGNISIWVPNQRLSIWRTSQQTNSLKLQGTSFLRSLKVLSLYSPQIFPVSPQTEPKEPLFSMGSTHPRFSVKRVLEPYLHPMMKQIEKENLPILEDHGFELVDFTAGKPFTLLQFSDGSRRAIEHGNHLNLWNFPKLNVRGGYAGNLGNDLMASTFWEKNGKFILFRNQGSDRETWVPFCVNQEENSFGVINELPETMDEKREDERDGKKTPEIPENFMPFETLRGISPGELTEALKNLGHDNEKLKFHERRLANRIPRFDSSTGRIVDFLECPSLDFVQISDDCLLLADKELGFGKFDFEAQKFEWFIAWNPRISKEKIPCYLSGGKYFESVKKLAVVNWKHQVEIFDLERGESFSVEFPEPDANDFPEGERKTLPDWKPGDMVELDLVPGKNGAFTLILGHDEYYEPMEEESAPLDEESSESTQEMEQKENPEQTPDANDEKNDSEKDKEDSDAGVSGDSRSSGESGISSQESPEKDEGETQQQTAEQDILTEYSPLDEDSFPLNHALLCHFDDKGKPLWKNSRFIQKSYFLKNIPSGIPLIGLGHLETSGASHSRQKDQSAAWRFFDQRNGRIIYDAKSPQTLILFMEGDPAKKEAQMALTGMTLKFSFSDEPYAENHAVLSDSRALLGEQIKRREAELKSSSSFLLAKERSFEAEKKAFEQKKDSTEDEKKYFAERSSALEMELKVHRDYLEKESKAIQELKDKLEAENKRHGGPLPEEEKEGENENAPNKEKKEVNS